MQTIRTAGHRYWNPCGSLLAFLWEKIYNVLYSMQWWGWDCNSK